MMAIGRVELWVERGKRKVWVLSKKSGGESCYKEEMQARTVVTRRNELGRSCWKHASGSDDVISPHDMHTARPTIGC